MSPQCKLWYYKGNYSKFKAMEVQKRRERIKEYEKQEKRLRELKASGQSKKKAESKQKEALTRKQVGETKVQMGMFKERWALGCVIPYSGN